jgi:hypothetical protein
MVRPARSRLFSPLLLASWDNPKEDPSPLWPDHPVPHRREFPEVDSTLRFRPGAATSVPRKLTPKIRESEKHLQRELDLS